MKTPARLFHEALLAFNKANKTNYVLGKFHKVDTKVPWDAKYIIINVNSICNNVVGYVIEENVLVTNDEVLDNIATKTKGMKSNLVPAL